MTLNQEECRELLEVYLQNTGIKVRYLCKRLGLDETIISHFRHGRKELYESDLQKLTSYLQNHLNKAKVV